MSVIEDRQESGQEPLAAIFRQTAPVQAILERLASGNAPLLLEGVSAPAGALLATSLAMGRTVVLLVGSQDAGERAADSVAVYAGADIPWFFVVHSPAFLEDSSVASSPATVDRLAALDCLALETPCFLVVTIAGLLQQTYSPRRLRSLAIHLGPGEELNLELAVRRLVEMGYQRVDMVRSMGDFAVRGGILDVFPANARSPIRVDLFGDVIDTVRTFDQDTQRSTGALESCRILPACEPMAGSSFSLLDYLPPSTLFVVDDAAVLRRRWDEFEGEVREQLQVLQAGARAAEAGDAAIPIVQPPDAPPFLTFEDAAARLEHYPTLFLNVLSHNVPWGSPVSVFSLSCEPVQRVDGAIEALAGRIRAWRQHNVMVWLISRQYRRIAELLREQGIPVVTPPGTTDASADESSVFACPGVLSEGYFIPSARTAVLSDTEIWGEVKIHRSRRTSRESTPLSSLLELRPGDLVVHVDHGIGLFRGMETMEVEGVRRDYLHLEYGRGDKLFVPADQIERVQRYIGSEDHLPSINRLGGGEWTRTKRRVRDQVEQMAKELLDLYAARSARDGHACGADTPWQQEVESAFVYDETADQMRAIQDVKTDLESSRPMDRLICGDVGYGKTEVALRAAFKVVMDGKQVAILVPTTVLAQQHLNTFTERLSGFPVRVDMLSRFRSRKEQQETIHDLKDGRVDIVIGTHRLLSRDVAFKDLGLVVVDEEQRFGVGHKEKLKQIRQLVDVLTLTATPIPRTLHMSLSSIRDMSVMNQAPEGRTSVRTYLRESSDDLVRQAILRELERDGQAYYVHNRVESLPHVVDSLRRLAPQARIAMAHGQMPENDLEQVMLEFYDRQFDVLCCTTIIESGLDIPNVNTIVINDADRLGLAQLYQLRGRVGRSNRQAYCYLLFNPDNELTELAQKRLHALREFTDLGSGFRIALRDLEIRGAGNLLGPEQHGALMCVGFDLYCQMIAEAVRVLKDEPAPVPLPMVDLPVQAYLPAEFIRADSLRVEFYKRLNGPHTYEDLQSVQEELQDRFGALPAVVRNLLAVMRLRIQCLQIGVLSIQGEKGQVVIRLGPRLRLTPPAMLSLQRKYPDVHALTDRVVVPLEQRGALGPVGEVMDWLRSLVERRKMVLGKDGPGPGTA